MHVKDCQMFLYPCAKLSKFKTISYSDFVESGHNSYFFTKWPCLGNSGTSGEIKNMINPSIFRKKLWTFNSKLLIQRVVLGSSLLTWLYVHFSRGPCFGRSRSCKSREKKNDATSSLLRCTVFEFSLERDFLVIKCPNL